MTRDSKITTILLAFLLAALVCAYTAASDPLSLAVPGVTPASPSEPAPSWYAVYFTDPASDTFRGGPDSALVTAMKAAGVTIDVASYDLDLWSVRSALLDAAARGVAVRLVAEAGSMENLEMRELAAAGIPIVTDRTGALMHDKFVIIDRRQVWTGSMNFTLNGAYRNDNNLLLLNDPAAAAAYLAEFNEMFEQQVFGQASPADQGVLLDLDGTRVEIYFSPDTGVSARIIDLLHGAQESIRFMAFAFTSDPIAGAVRARHREGLLVQGVLDESQARAGSGGEFEPFLAAGLEVRLDGSPGKMHHKVIIIDDRIVITGSYNFSRSAEERNDENVVIIFSEAVARQYLEEWARVWSLAK